MAGKSPRDRPHTFVRDKFCQLYPATAYASGTWLKFNGCIWESLPDFQVSQQAQAIIDKDKTLKLRATSYELKSIIELIKVKCSIPDKALDNEPNLITFADCTIEINTRARRDHNPKDYLTSHLPFAYDPQVRSDVWEYFLDKVIPGDCRDFLQEFAGYCLTTDMSHELSVWLYGPQGCGKSTFIEGIQSAMGQRVTFFNIHNLEDRFGLSHLQGKTLAISTETPSTIRQVQLLNHLISGEGLKVQRKYQDPYDLFNHAKFLWAMNRLPKAEDYQGLDRRAVIIQMPPLLDVKDENVKRQIKLAGQAIINWMLDGYDRLQARGRFEVPSNSGSIIRLASLDGRTVEID